MDKSEDRIVHVSTHDEALDIQSRIFGDELEMVKAEYKHKKDEDCKMYYDLSLRLAFKLAECEIKLRGI